MNDPTESPPTRLRVVAWPDPVLDRVGFPLSHPYVEYCWAPLLGPSTTLVWRRVASLISSQRGAVEVDLGRLGADLGIPGTGVRGRRTEKSLQRLCVFELARWEAPDTIAVRTVVPPLSGRRLRRAGETSLSAHQRFVQARAERENPLLGAALSYAARGWAVFPLRVAAKEPDGRLAPHGLRDATCDPARIRAWWTASPQANVGLRTGDAIDVIDVDGPRSVLESSGPAPLVAGSVVSTGRGWHLYFAPSGLPTKAGVLPGIDVRGVGGYVVAPPSLHPSGHRYRFVDPSSGAALDGPHHAPLPVAPAWVVELCRPERPAAPAHSGIPRRLDAGSYARAALEGECAAVAATPEGSRNDRLNRAAFAAGTLVGAGALEETSATEHLLAAALKAGLSETEARRTIDSGLGAGGQRPRPLGEGRHPTRRPAGRATAAVLARPAPTPDEGPTALPSRIPGRGVRR